MGDCQVRRGRWLVIRLLVIRLWGDRFGRPCWPVIVSLLASAPAQAQTSEIAKTREPPAAESTVGKAPAPADPARPAAVWDAGSATIAVTPAAARDTTQIHVTALDIATDGPLTRLQLTLTGVAEHQVFLLAEPYRVIVDLPHVTFRLPPATAKSANGLISAFRYGVFAADRSRIVLDTNGPVKIRAAAVQPATPSTPYRLVIDMEQTDPQSFLATPPPAPRDARAAIFDDAVVWPKTADQRPVVVIDPGHGGIDSGAVAPGDIQEKDVVLAVARHLSTALSANGRFDVRLTRGNDTFLSLTQRINVSATARASLFISLHADSIADPAFAISARGASVYTLSERASNRAAQASADKENAVDALAGVENLATDSQDQVKSILFDLTKRETQTFSNDFRRMLLDKVRTVTTLARDPGRSADFKVLKQSESPSVLIELGYLSNPSDAKQLTSDDWQKQVARAIAAAVDAYFSRSLAKKP